MTKQDSPDDMAWPELSPEKYEKIRSAIRNFLLSLGANEQDIECITHKVLEELKNQPRLFEDDNFDELMGAALRRAKWRQQDIVKRSKRFLDPPPHLNEEHESVDPIDEIPLDSLPPDAFIEKNPEESCLADELWEQALRCLNENEKKVVQMVIKEGYTIPETALRLRGSDNTTACNWVYKQRSRAIKKLRDNLDFRNYLNI